MSLITLLNFYFETSIYQVIVLSLVILLLLVIITTIISIIIIIFAVLSLCSAVDITIINITITIIMGIMCAVFLFFNFVITMEAMLIIINARFLASIKTIYCELCRSLRRMCCVSDRLDQTFGWWIFDCFRDVIVVSVVDTVIRGNVSTWRPYYSSIFQK